VDELYHFGVAVEALAVGVVGFLPVAVEAQETLVAVGTESLTLVFQTGLASVVPGKAYFAGMGELIVVLAIHRQFAILAILRAANVVGQGDCLHRGK
jgi:hypothetical protein